MYVMKSPIDCKGLSIFINKEFICGHLTCSPELKLKKSEQNNKRLAIMIRSVVGLVICWDDIRSQDVTHSAVRKDRPWRTYHTGRFVKLTGLVKVERKAGGLLCL